MAPAIRITGRDRYRFFHGSKSGLEINWAPAPVKSRPERVSQDSQPAGALRMSLRRSINCLPESSDRLVEVLGVPRLAEPCLKAAAEFKKLGRWVRSAGASRLSGGSTIRRFDPRAPTSRHEIPVRLARPGYPLTEPAHKVACDR